MRRAHLRKEITWPLAIGDWPIALLVGLVMTASSVRAQQPASTAGEPHLPKLQLWAFKAVTLFLTSLGRTRVRM